MGHGKGYIWSSRASVMNQIFGSDIMEVAVRFPGEDCYFSRAFDVSDVKEILPKGWDITKESFSDGEVYNKLVYVGDEPIEYECGKRLYSAEEEKTGNIVSCLNTCLQNKFI